MCISTFFTYDKGAGFKEEFFSMITQFRLARRGRPAIEER